MKKFFSKSVLRSLAIFITSTGFYHSLCLLFVDCYYITTKHFLLKLCLHRLGIKSPSSDCFYQLPDSGQDDGSVGWQVISEFILDLFPQ